MKKRLLQVTAYLDFLLDWLWTKHHWLFWLVAVSAWLSVLVALVDAAFSRQWGFFALYLTLDVLEGGGIILLMQWAKRARQEG